jgi:hypothetical protein
VATSGILFPVISEVYAKSLPRYKGSSSQSGNYTSELTGPWTPPQYSQPAVTILTVPSSGNPVLVQAPITGTDGTTSAPVYQGGTPASDYVFDAILRLNHKRSIEKTSHPVLTGANISDHFYVKPSRVVLEIGMSDAMSSFTAGVWVGASTKSVSAWQILKSLQIAGTLFTLTTRLDTYYNMMIIDLDTSDDHKTLHGLRASVVLEELLSAAVVSTAGASSRDQASGSTSLGTIQGTSINSTQQEQNVFPSSLYPDAPTYPNVPGAGDVSSTSLSQVP